MHTHHRGLEVPAYLRTKCWHIQHLSQACWNMQISYCINASIVELTMLGRRAIELVLRGPRDSQYGQLQ